MIKESNIKRAVINPGNYRRRTGCGYHLFVNARGLCFGRGLAPPAAASPRRHKSTVTLPRSSDVRRHQVAEEVRAPRPPGAPASLVIGVHVTEQVCAIAQAAETGAAGAFGRTELLNTAREEKEEENAGGGGGSIV